MCYSKKNNLWNSTIYFQNWDCKVLNINLIKSMTETSLSFLWINYGWKPHFLDHFIYKDNYTGLVILNYMERQRCRVYLPFPLLVYNINVFVKKKSKWLACLLCLKLSAFRQLSNPTFWNLIVGWGQSNKITGLSLKHPPQT